MRAHDAVPCVSRTLLGRPSPAYVPVLAPLSSTRSKARISQDRAPFLTRLVQLAAARGLFAPSQVDSKQEPRIGGVPAATFLFRRPCLFQIHNLPANSKVKYGLRNNHQDMRFRCQRKGGCGLWRGVMWRGSRVQGVVATGLDAKVVIPRREMKVPKFPCKAVSRRYRGNRGQ